MHTPLSKFLSGLCLTLLLLPTAHAEETPLHIQLMQRFASLEKPANCASEEDFKDLGGMDPREIQAISDAQDLCIVKGRFPGLFMTYDSITRAEIAKILVLAFNIPMTQGGTAFTDVPSDAWFAPYVAALTQAKIIRGYPDGTFRPHQRITHAELLKMSLEAAFQNTTFLSSSLHYLQDFPQSLQENVEDQMRQRDIDRSRWYFPYTLIWDQLFSDTLFRSMTAEYALMHPDRTIAISTIMHLRSMSAEDMPNLEEWMRFLQEVPQSLNVILWHQLLGFMETKDNDIYRTAGSSQHYYFIEYGSMEDPYTKYFHPIIAESLRKHPNMVWIFRPKAGNGRNYPQDAYEVHAVTCARIAGGADAAWYMIDRLIGQMDTVPEDWVREIAGSGGFYTADFAKCLGEGPYMPTVYSVTDTSRTPFTGTPQMYVYDPFKERVIAIDGALDAEALERVLVEFFAGGA